MKLVPVIMSGGSGTRLWPLSRGSFPKPFIRLPDGKSLLQHCMQRILQLPEVSEVLTIANRELLFSHEDEYRELGQELPTLRYLLEPEGRDTAAAIATATQYVIETSGADAVMCVFPSDHLIEDVAAFCLAVEEAAELARQGRLVTFGIRPTRAETGYGYIQSDGSKVVRFIEKPDLESAEKYSKDPAYFWNSGMFCFTARTMLEAFEKHCPDIWEACRQSLSAAQRVTEQGFEQVRLDRDRFRAVRKESIDYAIFEKAENVSVIPCEFGWQDIGSWEAFSDLLQEDGSGNRLEGPVTLRETENTIVHTSGRRVATLGVDDLMIIDTDDALLVAARDRAQDVKAVVGDIAREDAQLVEHHRTVHRPWGSYTVLEEGPRFKIKRIEVKPGGRLSLQSHKHRAEHWVVVSGSALVTNGENVQRMETDQSTYIPLGARHRLENPEDEPLVMIEVQSGDYLGEDDITRYEDIYGRE